MTFWASLTDRGQAWLSAVVLLALLTGLLALPECGCPSGSDMGVCDGRSGR